MTRKIFGLLAGFLFLLACNNETSTEKTTLDSPKSIVENSTPLADTNPPGKAGDETDEHGCRTSAGYSWSMIKKTCIRLLETGTRLEPKDPSLDKTTRAYILFSDDRVRAEIFLPTQKRSVVIRRSSAENEPEKWANGPLSLTFLDGSYSLYDEAKLLYQGAAK